jgi:glycolate oxidase FAD binding subunit
MPDISVALIEQVAEAYTDQRALRIIGGQSKAGLIARTIDLNSTEDIAVAGHSGVVMYDPRELILTARAGTSLSEIEQVLDENGQMLSFEPPQFKSATLGGTLASNMSGPARPWRSSMRDMVLGVRLINGRGEHLRFGGQVMKNVAGYDLARLQAGALGSLGVITEISLKVLPKLHSSKTIMKIISQQGAITEMNQIAATSVSVTAAAWSEGKMYIRYQGSRPVTELPISDIIELEDSRGFWQSLRNQTHSFFQTEKPLWRFSIKPTSTAFFETQSGLVEWAGAQRWIAGDFNFDEMQGIARSARGHVSLYRGGQRTGEVRQSVDAIQRNIQQRLKLSFDPKRILNPGTLYSWM